MRRATDKTAVGGLKVVAGGACVACSGPKGHLSLAQGACAALACNKINLTLLAHVGDGCDAGTATAFCTERKAGADSYSLTKAHLGPQGLIRLYPGTCIVSLFPHDKRPDIVGNFLRSLVRAKVVIRALASSRSAISGVLSLKAKDKAVDALFGHFRFPAFASAEEFHAAQPPPEELMRKVVAAYQEKVTRIYLLEQEGDLVLFALSLPSITALEDLAAALLALGRTGLKMPFLVAVPRLRRKELLLAFATFRKHSDEVQEVLQTYLPNLAVTCQHPVAAIYMHGPHFGDRYGIAHTLVQALDRVQIPLLVLSCSVHSISAILWQEDLEKASQVLSETFLVPG